MPRKSAGKTSLLSRFWLRLTAFDWLITLLVFVVSARVLMDPDLGWHLRSGMDLLKNLSVPKFDPYSHTLPDWPWVDHEWLMNGIVAFIYQHLGAFILIGLFAALITGAFILAASISKVEYKYKVLAAAIAVLAALPILGVRMQMVTLLGMGLTLWILYRYRQGQLKYLWWFLPIFLLWANLHGGFIMGLIILAVFFIVELAKFLVQTWRPKLYKKLNISEDGLNAPQLKHLFFVGLLSGAVTLINPYGWGLYYDFYKLFTNPFAISHISEWNPVSFSNPIAQNYIIYLIVLGIVLLLTYRKIEPTRWIITLVFLYLSLMYWRNMPFFMVMSVGFIAEILQAHTHLVFDWVTSNRWLMIVTVIIISVLSAQRLNDVVPKTLDLTRTFTAGGYPTSAVQWAKANPDKIGTTMFNEYGWGGFLIWQFPEQKVFLDGRMPYWQVGDRFVFVDEQYIVNGGQGALAILTSKYHVDWVLVHTGRPLDLILYGRQDWKKVYNDKVAVIYRKIETNGTGDTSNT